jgi:hypothetical protein
LVFVGTAIVQIQTAVLFCSVSVIVAEAVKNQLKFLFGRTWPATWIQNNPSFLRDGAYGFNILHGGVGYGLIGPNFHFLSDVIEGAFVGISTGWMTINFGKADDSSDIPK